MGDIDIGLRTVSQVLPAELAATTRVIAERSKRVAGLGERVAGILGEEIIMQSEFLRTLRDKTRAETRREDIMRFARRLLDEAEVEQVQDIEDLDELEREVMRRIEARTRAGDRGA